MQAEPDTVRTEHGHQPLPEEVDVVVIGGGVVGVTTAIFLSRAGQRVAVLEKGRIAGEQSSRNWGWIRKQGRDKRELPVMLESVRQWERLGKEVGENIGLGRRSTTYLALNEKELAARLDWLDSVREFQLDTKLLSSAETDELLGRNDRAFAGALHTPSDMTAEPRLAVPALARLAASEGVFVLESCAVRTVERHGGRVGSVITERGEVTCQSVVLAGGAWSRTFLENLGVFIPQLAVRSTALRTTPAPLIHPGGLGATGASVRRRDDGGYTIGRTNAAHFEVVPAAIRHFARFLPVMASRLPTTKVRFGPSFFGPLGRHRWKGDEKTPFEAVRVFDPSPDQKLAADTFATAKRHHPGLGEAKILEAWAGMIDVTPDEVPIVDELGIPGLYVATGLSGHGFGIGPGIGRLTADLVLNRGPVVDPTPFRAARFGIQSAA
ncbi:MAG: FAD-binding oxidoreductase [Pseudomonadota bacterium]